MSTPTARLEARIAQLQAELAKRDKKISKQASEIARQKQLLEAAAKENIARRRIIRNALDNMPGWEIDARAELDTRGKK